MGNIRLHRLPGQAVHDIRNIQPGHRVRDDVFMDLRIAVGGIEFQLAAVFFLHISDTLQVVFIAVAVRIWKHTAGTAKHQDGKIAAAQIDGFLGIRPVGRILFAGIPRTGRRRGGCIFLRGASANCPRQQQCRPKQGNASDRTILSVHLYALPFPFTETIRTDLLRSV